MDASLRLSSSRNQRLRSFGCRRLRTENVHSLFGQPYRAGYLKDSINVATLPSYGGLTESLAKLRIIFELNKQIPEKRFHASCTHVITANIRSPQQCARQIILILALRRCSGCSRSVSISFNPYPEIHFWHFFNKKLSKSDFQNLPQKNEIWLDFKLKIDGRKVKIGPAEGKSRSFAG